MSTVASVGIVPRGTYDFQHLREGVVSMPIAQRVDVAAAEQLTLEIWIHDGRVPEEAAIAIVAAADGYSPECPTETPLQTKTPGGDDIARLTVNAGTRLPLFQTLPVPVLYVPRILAVVLEVRGGKEGPCFSLSVDLVLRETEGSAAIGIEPIVTSPDQEDASQAQAGRRIAAAARLAVQRIPRRYPRWREIWA